WRELSPSCRGAAVEWDTASGPVSGIAAGIDDDGALRVRVGDQIHRIISGEVRWK
ncbi:MAG: biotin--[acetyl-CoA-carboxylase] ligase, partial [Acidobacteria bacterium]|nr:biotin--[acetyl-CoA-carboxylase] ligase [Acidobacteriota bacterium]